MPTTNLHHTVDIDVSPAVVYAHIAEPKNYIGLAPLVIEVRDVQYGMNADDKPIRGYKSVELFKFLGFIRYHNVIKVLSTLEIQDELLVNEVESPFNVTVRFEDRLTPLNNGRGTRMTENISLSAPALLMNFATTQAKTSQEIRMWRLKERLEENSQLGD